MVRGSGLRSSKKTESLLCPAELVLTVYRLKMCKPPPPPANKKSEAIPVFFETSPFSRAPTALKGAGPQNCGFPSGCPFKSHSKTPPRSPNKTKKAHPKRPIPPGFPPFLLFTVGTKGASRVNSVNFASSLEGLSQNGGPLSRETTRKAPETLRPPMRDAQGSS